MTKLSPGDLAGTRLFLLSHLDPLVAIDVADRAARHPEQAGMTSTVIFGQHVVPVIQPLLRDLLSGALDLGFTDDLFDVVEHSRLPLSLVGLRTLRGLSSTLAITDAPPPYQDIGSGAMTGPDAVCDLMMQPLMAFSNLVAGLSDMWVQFAAAPNPPVLLYRTNQSSHFDARLENRIRLTLGFRNHLSDEMLIHGS